MIEAFCIVFVFGAVVGSFLNVCIHRIPNRQSIVSPGSSCPFCKSGIPWYLNIPLVSYLLLRGRCRFCSQRISIRYPLVEALTGLAAMAVLFQFGLTAEALFWFAFIAVLITISFIDLDHQIIPDVLSLPGICCFASSFYLVPGMTWQETAAGILAGGGILYAVAFLYSLARKEEGMGGGDIKLLAMIGAATGVKGVLFTLFAGSLLGTLAGAAVMVATRTANHKLKIPFGPFLSAGAVAYIFCGSRLIQWYFGVII